MKKEIRILGIDDASFDKFNDNEALVIGVLFRGGQWMDGCMSTIVEVDGDDATAKIAGMIKKSKFLPQIQCIMLDGIAVAGFNVVDIEALSRETKIPVIVVMRDFPEVEKMKDALVKLGMGGKVELLDKAGVIEEYGKIHFQARGMSGDEAREFLKISCTRSDIPEPIRVAHLIGAGISRGESRGRA